MTSKITLGFALAASLFTTGCDSLQTRPEINAPGKHHQGTSAQAPARSTPTVTVTEPQSQGSLAPPPMATPPPVPTHQPPTFLNRDLPKIGLILGPGGMKAFAHIGALRELARARIPVHAVVGLEWGAVIGAFYAAQGQANDAEWKGFKLRDQDLPTEGGFLSSKIKAQSVGALGPFFDATFGTAVIENTKIDFACPAYWSRVDRFGWMSKGLMREAMRACLPYPPLLTDNSGVWAAPFAVDEAAAYLRSRGANLIVLVNVLGAGEFFPAKLAQGEHAAENLLWSEIRREYVSAKPPTVHLVISVNTSGHPLTDLAGRRALLDKGAKAASDVVQKLVSQYGF